MDIIVDKSFLRGACGSPAVRRAASRRNIAGSLAPASCTGRVPTSLRAGRGSGRGRARALVMQGWQGNETTEARTLAIDDAGADRFDSALMNACIAIDPTSRKLYPKVKVGQRFVQCLRDYYWLLEPMLGAGMNLVETRFEPHARSRHLRVTRRRGAFARQRARRVQHQALVWPRKRAVPHQGLVGTRG